MLPLAGVRVLAVEQYGAGPFGTMFLADQGAEVIKVENPNDGGDMARTVGPHFFANGESQFYHSFNRNKKSLALDLSRPDGQEIFHRLVKDADAVCSNLRGDVPAKLGLTYETLKSHNAAIVCAHLSAYGRTGPRASWPGYDYLMQAEAGFMSLTGEPDGAPAKFGLSMVDLITGLGLSYALLAALTAARSTGEGRDIDVSLFDMALHCTNYVAAWYLNSGAETGRLPRSQHPALTPCQLYKTKDSWLFLMCNKEKFWPQLCHEIGKPEMAEDERFATFAARLQHRDLIQGLLDEALSVKTTSEWLEQLTGKLPVAQVNSLSEALENPYVVDNGKLQTLQHPDLGEFQLVAAPIRDDNETPAMPAPGLGAHTDDLLREAGYSNAEIDRFRRDELI